MSKLIDAKGQNCPIPVILAKKEMDGGETAFLIEVDNQVAVQNLTRLAEKQDYRVDMEGGPGCYRLSFRQSGTPAVILSPPSATLPTTDGASWAVLVPSDIIGEGDRELGATLMKMYFYVLTQQLDNLPESILLMNGGVKLATQNEEIAAHLKTLSASGVQVLVCGTCLNFYGLSQALRMGVVSNLYEIMGRMQAARKVITL